MWKALIPLVPAVWQTDKFKASYIDGGFVAKYLPSAVSLRCPRNYPHGMSNLRHLTVAITSPTPKYLTASHQYPKLTSLEILYQHHYTSRLFRHISFSTMPHLQALTVLCFAGLPPIPVADLESLCEFCTSLRSLCITQYLGWAAESSAIAPHLSRLAELRSLRIPLAELEISKMNPLHFPHLETLQLSCKDVKSFEALKKFSSLRSLHLTEAYLPAALVRSLCTLTNVTKLEMLILFDALCELVMPQLKQLTFGIL